MTTLFNLFCPVFLNFQVKLSVFLFVMINLFFLLVMVAVLTPFNYKMSFLFPHDFINSMSWVSLFLFISMFNLFSLSFASFPSTTVLLFNFSLAFNGWLASMFFFVMNKQPFYLFTPLRAPWYLIMFLVIIEMVSLMVRPLTLCFRLMANMSAGHILLALATKLSFNLWWAGALFGLLELMVCVVQGYVFTLLLKVYTEEYI